MAVLEKVRQLPWEAQTKMTDAEVIDDIKHNEVITTSERKRPKKRIKLGYKEDPFVFFGDNEEVWNSVR